MSLKRICAASTTAVVMTLAGAAAVAQEADPQGTALIVVSSSSTTTTIVGGVILTVVLTGQKSNIETYLRDNAVALRHDISQGGGATVTDLADVFGIDATTRASFAKMLRRNREDLLPLLDSSDTQRAQRFVEIVVEAGRGAGLFEPLG